MYTHWRVLTDTKTESKARRVLDRLQTAMGEDLLNLRIEPHHERGYQALFEIDHGDLSHPEAVVAALECTEYISGPWMLGFVQPFHMYTTQSSFPGIDLAEFFLRQSAGGNDDLPPPSS